MLEEALIGLEMDMRTNPRTPLVTGLMYRIRVRAVLVLGL